MKQKELTAYIRDEKGKQANKALRKSGSIPAVVYGHNEDPIVLSCDEKELELLLHTAAGENVVLNLKIMKQGAQKEERSEPVIIKEIQHNPIKGNILHIDFNHISLTEKITVKVPLEIKGEAAGVKMGGLVEHILWELEVECLPTQIPEKITINVSTLEIGDAIHIKDITVPDGVTVLNDPDQVAITVEPPKTETVEETTEEEETQAEPEVTKQKEPEATETEESSKKA